MISIKDYRVQIQGSSEELRQDLIDLHLTIMQDKGLLEIGTDAVKEAHSFFLSGKFESTDLRDGKR